MSVSSIIQRNDNEDFFEYACRIKGLPLSDDEMKAGLIEDRAHPYVATLHGIFQQQLKLRMGEVTDQISSEFLQKKVRRLVVGFLKEKLKLKKPIEPAHDFAQRAKWDPHYHVTSLFADRFPKARHFLPNYEEAYVYLRSEHRALTDRVVHVKDAMNTPQFATIIEGGSGYDNWHIEHEGKKIIPILAHKRENGAVIREDVTGYDVCGLEIESRYVSQQAFLQSVQGSKVVRIHMGETIVPARGREHVHLLLDEVDKHYSSSKPLRIGHATHISIEDMIRVAKKGHFIEACLSSNKKTVILDKRSEYPLGVMLLLGVKVVLGTDGGPLYSTTLAEEFAHAKRNLQKFHEKLKACDERVQLPNGDFLCRKHIVSTNSDDILTYKELGFLLDLKCLERISCETLVSNANTLFEECYS